MKAAIHLIGELLAIPTIWAVLLFIWIAATPLPSEHQHRHAVHVRPQTLVKQ